MHQPVGVGILLLTELPRAATTATPTAGSLQSSTASRSRMSTAICALLAASATRLRSLSNAVVSGAVAPAAAAACWPGGGGGLCCCACGCSEPK